MHRLAADLRLSRMTTAATVRERTLALLAKRLPGRTVCPSEVARSLQTDLGSATGKGAGEEWRALMPLVHAAVDALLDENVVRLSWKGKSLPSRYGPYRIGLAPRD
jgi:hypothetical protein